VLEETPPFYACDDAGLQWIRRGRYETHSTKAYFNVTLAGEELDAGAHCGTHGGVSTWGRLFQPACNGGVSGALCAVFLWAPQVSSKVRKTDWSEHETLKAGAHYCEQMMLDQGVNGAMGWARGASGYSDGEADSSGGSCRMLLLRDGAVFVVSLRLHTGGR